MYKIIKEGNTYNIPVKEFLIDTEAEISTLPKNIPFGSYLTILEPFSIRILNSSGKWVDITGGESN